MVVSIPMRGRIASLNVAAAAALATYEIARHRPRPRSGLRAAQIAEVRADVT